MCLCEGLSRLDVGWARRYREGRKEGRISFYSTSVLTEISIAIVRMNLLMDCSFNNVYIHTVFRSRMNEFDFKSY